MKVAKVRNQRPRTLKYIRARRARLIQGVAQAPNNKEAMFLLRTLQEFMRSLAGQKWKAIVHFELNGEWESTRQMTVKAIRGGFRILYPCLGGYHMRPVRLNRDDDEFWALGDQKHWSKEKEKTS